MHTPHEHPYGKQKMSPFELLPDCNQQISPVRSLE